MRLIDVPRNYGDATPALHCVPSEDIKENITGTLVSKTAIVRAYSEFPGRCDWHIIDSAKARDLPRGYVIMVIREHFKDA